MGAVRRTHAPFRRFPVSIWAETMRSRVPPSPNGDQTSVPGRGMYLTPAQDFSVMDGGGQPGYLAELAGFPDILFDAKKGRKVLRFTLLSALSLLALSGCNKEDQRTGDAPGYAEAAFAAYPGTSVRFYDVDGTDVKSIRAALDALGPKGRRDGKSYDAETDWHATWHWPGGADGKCDLEHLEFSFQIIVILPHLHDHDRVSPAVRKAWGRYMAALIDHESGHAKHAYEHKGDIEKAVKSSSCDGANAAGLAVIAEMSRFDVQYDAETHHGVTQGALFPG